MENLSLTAQPRTTLGKANAKLRAEGKTPGVVYGHSVQAQPIEFDAKELEKIYAHAGGSKLVNLQIGDAKANNVLIHDAQIDARTGAVVHVDLYQVRMDEKIKTDLPLRFVGESTAVYQDEGTLLKNLESLEIEALPGDLPEALEVDISILDDFEKTIHVSDLVAPKGVEILTDAEELVAKVDPPRTDAEMEELDEAVTEELPEGVAEDQEAVSEENEGNKDKESKGQ